MFTNMDKSHTNVIHPELKAQIQTLLFRKFDKESKDDNEMKQAYEFHKLLELEILDFIQTKFEENQLTIHNINDAIEDDGEGMTLLHYACKKLYVRLVHFLATNFYYVENNSNEKGANINIKDLYYQNTPLHDAVMWPPVFQYNKTQIVETENNRKLVVQILIEYNANVNAKNKGGETPIFHSYPNEDVMKLLLDAGAVVTNESDYDGKTIWEDPMNDLYYCLEENDLCENGFDKTFRMIKLLVSNYDHELPEEFREIYNKAIQKFNEKSSAQNIAELDENSASNVATFLGGNNKTNLENLDETDVYQITQQAFNHNNMEVYEQKLNEYFEKYPYILNKEYIINVIKKIQEEQDYFFINQQKNVFDMFTFFVQKCNEETANIETKANKWIQEQLVEKGITNVNVNELRLALHDSKVEQYFLNVGQTDSKIFESIRENNYKMINDYYVYVAPFQRSFNKRFIDEFNFLLKLRDNWKTSESNYETRNNMITVLNKFVENLENLENLENNVTQNDGAKTHLLRKSKKLTWENTGGYRFAFGAKETEKTKHLNEIRERRNALENDANNTYYLLKIEKEKFDQDIKYGNLPEYISDPNQSRWTLGMKKIVNPEIETRKQNILLLENKYNSIKNNFEIADKEFWNVQNSLNSHTK